MKTIKKICKFCGDDIGKLFPISGSDGFICEECLDKYSQYGLCSDCNIVYEDNNFFEGDDGKFYCKEHIMNHQDELSDDKISFIENANNR